MLHGYKYRIYPTEEQKVMLAKTFGCCRYVYNWALDLKEKTFKEENRNINFFTMTALLRELRTENPWLNEVSKQALSYAILDLFKGYKYYFEGLSNKPGHHVKNSRQHFRDEGNNTKVDFERGTLSFTKIRGVSCKFHRRFNGKIKGVSIELLPSGHYFASVLVEEDIAMPTPPEMEVDRTLGIDTGLKHEAVLSDGRAYEAIRTSEKDKRKLKLMQRQRARKTIGSRQYRILSKRIAKQFEHMANCRHDKVHKLTHEIASDSQATTICVEDLYVEGIKRNKHLSYTVSDAAIGMLYRQLEYKCKMAGKNFVKISKFAPSSKMCSHCGHINKGLNLKDREWTCPECGTHHDRDINAAINIKHFGLSDKSPYPRYWGKVTPVEQPLVDDRSSEPKKRRCYSVRWDRAGKTGKSRERILRPLSDKR